MKFEGFPVFSGRIFITQCLPFDVCRGCGHSGQIDLAMLPSTPIIYTLRERARYGVYDGRDVSIRFGCTAVGRFMRSAGAAL